MSTLVFAPAAANDMDYIWDYTVRQWGADQADRYTDDIRDACHDLAHGKKKGRTTSVRKGYRKYAVGKHAIFFRRSGAGVEVIRILHQSMDFERHL